MRYTPKELQTETQTLCFNVQTSYSYSTNLDCCTTVCSPLSVSSSLTAGSWLLTEMNSMKSPAFTDVLVECSLAASMHGARDVYFFPAGWWYRLLLSVLRLAAQKNEPRLTSCGVGGRSLKLKVKG